MCNCIKEIEVKIHEKYPTHNGKTVEKVQAESTYRFPDFMRITATNYNLVIENQKKQIPIMVSHTYCPWCGEKIPETEEK